MKKGNMTILASVLAIALVALGVGMGTMAYFSSTATATGNTFTAGTLNVELSLTETGGYSDSISGVWASPDDWAPGDTFSGRVYFKNKGNVPAMVGLVDLYNFAGYDNFKDKIELVTLYESYEGWGVNHASLVMEGNWGDNTAPLTLRELMDTPNDVGGIDDCDYILFATSPGACTETHEGSKALLGGTYLAAGATGWIYMEFKFSNDADNTYQGKTASFDLELTFVQGPDGGLCRHELPGFHP